MIPTLGGLLTEDDDAWLAALDAARVREVRCDHCQTLLGSPVDPDTHQRQWNDITVTCPFGQCTVMLCPTCGRIHTAWGAGRLRL